MKNGEKRIHTINEWKKIEFELYPEAAPGTVANFEKLANEGFYDGLKFHRVIPGFVSQGGDQTVMELEDLVTQLNVKQKETLISTRGSLSMAHAGKDTGGSQFFIVHDPQPHLNGVHTVLAK